jgi:hypothetical protein
MKIFEIEKINILSFLITIHLSSLAFASNFKQFTSNLQFMGLTTSTYNGNLGGLNGANQKCDTQWSGSHVCTYEEIKRIGYNTSMYAANFWVIDGLNINGAGGSYWDGTTVQDVESITYSTKDGASTTNNYITPPRNGCAGNWTSYHLQCDAWGSSSADDSSCAGNKNYYLGSYMSTSGVMNTINCASTLKLPCCR